jgi:hypothetical protein
MSTVFAKLNLKDHKQIVVLDSPGSFESELAALQSVARRKATPSRLRLAMKL